MPDSSGLSSRWIRRAALLGFLVTMAVFFITGSSSQAGMPDPFLSLKKKLIDDGFDTQTIESIYADPRVKEDVKMVRLFFRHREAKLDYGQFTRQQAIRKAKKYIRKHKATLDAVEQRYGVDQTVITAILLVETRLGVSVGKRRVLNTLSTLAALSDTAVRDAFFKAVSRKVSVDPKKFQKWSKRKSKWAYNELTAFLHYTAREDLDPLRIKGSYAGALGVAQFMPTSILAYAADGNRDGRVDLFDHADAAASIASYLKQFGWRPGIDRTKASKVIFRYNRSRYYVDTILKISNLLKKS